MLKNVGAGIMSSIMWRKEQISNCNITEAIGFTTKIGQHFESYESNLRTIIIVHKSAVDLISLINKHFYFVYPLTFLFRKIKMYK